MSAGPATHAAVAWASFEPLLALAGGDPEGGWRDGPAHVPAPLFCVHPAAGVGWEYGALAPHLGPDRALYTLQARGLKDPAALPGSVEEIAEDYLREVREVQPNGPYCLLGWSFGGAVAHGMATRLRAEGEQVGLLAILDWYPYDPARPEDEPSEHEYLVTLLENLGCGEARIRETAGWPVDRHGARHALLARGHALDFLPDDRLEAILRVFLHHVSLRPAHVPEVFDGSLLFFTAAAEPGAVPGRAVEAWRAFAAGPVENHDIEVEHRRMLQREPAARIGPLLARALEPVGRTPATIGKEGGAHS